MIARRQWPPYASPGWVALYTVEFGSWMVIAKLWGACVVLGLVVLGLALLGIAWEGRQR